MELKDLEQNALKAFENADEKGKQMLSDLFGAGIFNRPITERVKTFEDALSLVGCGDNMKILLDYNGVDKDMLASQAFAKLTIIAKALNEEWQPDWTNSSEYKYYAWLKGSSGAFVFDGYDFNFSFSYIGSRLVFKSSELAEYAGTQFESIYKAMFTL